MKQKNLLVRNNLIPCITPAGDAQDFIEKAIDALIERQVKIIQALMVIERAGVVESSEFRELVNELRHEVFE